WPPYSPDLNPIEHLWYHLKQATYQLLPDLDNLLKSEGLQVLCETLPRALQAILEEIVADRIKSMPRCLKAVIGAQGWQTKY
ncbi:hypothetical protein M433DRAFT_75519, partial [Acidomyces richmondensis BFW]